MGDNWMVVGHPIEAGSRLAVVPQEAESREEEFCVFDGELSSFIPFSFYDTIQLILIMLISMLNACDGENR